MSGGMSGGVRTVVMAALALTGPAAGPVMGRVPVEKATDWRRVATSADRARLRNWRETWTPALIAARAADARAMAAEPMLFAPDRGLPGAMPPVGEYRCRTFKLGARGTAMRGFTVYPWTDCRVKDERGVIGFSRRTGVQRPVGVIFPDGDARGVFLGTLVLGDESRALEYGRDANRDMVGIVERIGDRRWRIAFPEPRFESQLDVIEVVPAG